ncbi:acyl-CoA dehydrogenase family protein [Paraburkholderia tropica]|uniref:acyl-CoA dehydrogenase family protein n=1 Tax=Paraburkholderia tropica TaxID=92647 RepID=UPI002AB0307D|nr:acyl-CoA dehydrogenase family protein [Paraburkholderia tropica]
MSETQNLIAQSIERVLAEAVEPAARATLQSDSWPQRLWNTLDQAGFTHLLDAPAQASPAQWSDAYPVFHAIGRHAAPVPFAETALANYLIAAHGLPEREGPLAFLDLNNDPYASVTFEQGCLRLEGRVANVPWGRHAGALLVAARLAGKPLIALVDVTPAAIAIVPGANLAGEPRDIVKFHASRPAAFVRFDDERDSVDLLCHGALVRSAAMAGAVETLLDISVRYANERVQFGRPIAKFQAVQQNLAELAGEATSAQSAALAAFGCVTHAPRRFETGVAKIRTGRAAGNAASIAHQVHGAIGFTWEHALHHYTQRLWSWRTEYGTESQWADELGRVAIARRSTHFWPDITAHHAGVEQ